METDDVVAMVAGAKAIEIFETGDGMAHPDPTRLPNKGIAGAGFRDDLLSILHAVKIRPSSLRLLRRRVLARRATRRRRIRRVFRRRWRDRRCESLSPRNPLASRDVWSGCV